ncbi:hypothetical protein CK289_09200 [Salmonella enterica]|nr:hypothetical protein [Salmonella enterica]
MNTQALFCLSLPLVIAGCAQQTSTSTARDSAFAQSLRPPVFSDIYQRSPEVTRSGRYTLVSVKSADAQREPLNQLIDITMPGQLVNSVGDGFRQALVLTGFDQSNTRMTKNGTFTPGNFLLGGGRDGDDSRSTLVIIITPELMGNGG